MPLRLKSLELQGYKTFASRTLFLFSEGITAIVGPNGSGKSNIADSLRWVLGEQSYSLLRAKKSEDMIFSGSELRPRAGMASATITFDNSDGWLPIDFAEVAITRRSYRDGQNEYLINGQRVRLKDVTELLARSGLAERTYTIIGQGLVDAALALKAEERRKLFEEAAGTGLHRTRREEAQRRLEVTARNLERVQDILAELQPRLRSLERQARRAQEYEQVKADLRVLLREWYGYHWHSAQKALAEARENARAQEAALLRSREKAGELTDQLTQLRDRLQALRGSLNAWHRQSAQVHTRREAVSRELAVADERIRSLQEQQASAGVELARLEEELGLYREQVDSAQQEYSRLEAELNDARRQVEEARKALAARQAERGRAEKALQDARHRLSSLNARQSQLQARLAERQAQVERARQTLKSAEQAVAAAEKDLQAAQERARGTDEARQAAEHAYQQAEQAVAAARQRVAQVEASRREAQERRAAAAAELARLRAQLDVLDQAEQALSGYASGTRLLLEAARKQRLTGVSGALSAHLEVPAEYETAIAAALGEYLDAVLLDDNPDTALDLLGKDALRGVLLPLQALKPPDLPQVSLPEQDGTLNGHFLGRAADLVKAPPELRPAVDLLLGQVLVVRDRQTARRVLAGQPPQARAVTLAGEVFLAGGPVMTTGSGADKGGQTLLGRQRQRRELAGRIASAETDLQALDESLQGCERELKSLQAEVDRLLQEQRTKRKDLDQAAQAASQARLNEEQARRQVQWQQEQLKRQQADIARGEEEAGKLKKELAGLDQEIGRARDEVRAASGRLAELGLEEFQAELSHWNTRAAVAERALTDGKARLQERKAALERAERTRDGLQARRADLERQIASLDQSKAEQRKEEARIAEEIEALRKLIEPAEAELESLEKEQARLQDAEASARQMLSQAEHHHAQARIALARRQEAHDSLRQRIEDDFGLVAFEYTEDTSGPTPLPLDGMVEELPLVRQLSPEIEEAIKRMRAQLRRMGAINPEAQSEYQEVKERFDFLTEQVKDLQAAEADVRQVIAELDALMQREFRKTFDAVAVEFKEIFTRLFDGGSARLVLTDPDDLNETGIDIEARLPGRRTQGLSLLSGGERSLTAVALVFALLRVSPTPFCVLDEVDAMLDEANVGRYRELLRELSETTQFIVVTHNRNTVQAADVIYGVTMGRDSASQVLSLRLDQVSQVVNDQ